MAFTVSTSFSFGKSRTGLTDLRVQPRTAAGVTTGGALTGTFSEAGLGVYRWSGSVPDDAVFLDAYSVGTAGLLSVRETTLAAVKVDSGNLVARLGAFAGSGVNTVLGFFRAVMSKIASTPSDVGGTYDAASDSLEASAEQLVLIGRHGASYVNPVDVDDDDRLNLVAGDDYTAATRIPTWSVTNWTGPELDGTGKLRLVRLPRYAAYKLSLVPADLEVDATITVDGDTLTITAPITFDQTGDLAGATDTAGVDSHRYQLLGFDASAPTELVSIKLGLATVLRGIDEED